MIHDEQTTNGDQDSETAIDPRKPYEEGGERILRGLDEKLASNQDVEIPSKRRRHRMGEQRMSMIERIVHRIEEHIEEWRKQDAARKREADENRDKLWAAAAERERLLVEVINEEESRRDSLEEITKQHRLVFVAHSEEVAQTLEEFAREKDRLVKVVPGRQGSYAKEIGVKGSWLVFESP